jgi:hypothetical protein
MLSDGKASLRLQMLPFGLHDKRDTLFHTFQSFCILVLILT